MGVDDVRLVFADQERPRRAGGVIEIVQRAVIVDDHPAGAAMGAIGEFTDAAEGPSEIRRIVELVRGQPRDVTRFRIEADARGGAGRVRIPIGLRDRATVVYAGEPAYIG